MMEYKCHVCLGSCDPGELENGVCFDCRKESVKNQEKRESQIRKDLNQIIQSRIKEQKDGQLVMVMT